LIWWAWIVFGIVLLAAESATPGTLFFLFFGLSAIVVGGLTALGIAGEAWVQWLLFSALAIAALALLRRPLRGRLNLISSGHAVDSLVGQIAVALGDIPAGGIGKVELRGTGWSARATEGVALRQGQRVVVEKVEGLTLWVRPE
jgi:membrane protein implicated in regulation of membrane protease activity